MLANPLFRATSPDYNDRRDNNNRNHADEVTPEFRGTELRACHSLILHSPTFTPTFTPTVGHKTRPRFLS